MKFQLGASIVTFSVPGDYPAQRPMEFTQALDRTAAGTIRVEDLGPVMKRRVISWESMPKSDYDSLKSFVENVAKGSLNQFTFVDERDFSGTVRILDSVFDFQEDYFERFSGSILVEYV